jgi:hypothetical protein
MTNLNTLQQAVIGQLGYNELDQECLDTLSDVANHGADGGYGQFVYYVDTVAFAQKHKADIMARLKDMAEQLGEDSAYSLIKSFRCLNNDYSIDEIVEAIHTETDDSAKAQVLNALAWYALEETAGELTEY